MKTQKIQLPDGRLLTIEGGNAESTAKLIANHYLGQGPAQAAEEEALPVPGLSHDQSSDAPRGQPAPAFNMPSHFVANEEPLALPVMNFDKQ